MKKRKKRRGKEEKQVFLSGNSFWQEF